MVEQIKTLVQQEVQVVVAVVQVVYQLQQVDLELHVKEMLGEEHPIQLLLQVAVQRRQVGLHHRVQYAQPLLQDTF